jgi:hypothetical protein|eukprot:COSAG01_NODE_2031_length_8555_cov_4.407778_6_plen_57_part_00
MMQSTTTDWIRSASSWDRPDSSSLESMAARQVAVWCISRGHGPGYLAASSLFSLIS